MINFPNDQISVYCSLEEESGNPEIMRAMHYAALAHDKSL